ncbi:MAG TPA: alpha/beta hydrolase [Candidatus Acidoferrum sp.]|jgi:acetyl esterase/lipase|nr:alpha/beta hydrolase [Candidatus Acidoferrum sp.]
MTWFARREFLSSLGALALAPALFGRADGYIVGMKTLTYSSPGGKDLLLDLFLPEGAKTPLPTIIFLHGGGWSGGTRATGPDFRRFFAQDGFAMASIEYRLTPSVTFPSNVEDVKTSIRWLRANAASYGLDPNRIGLWGTSAGATLACVAALTRPGMFEGEGNLDQSSAVQCVLDAYGPTFFTLMDVETDQEKATLQTQPAALASAAPMVGGVVVAGGGDRGRGPAPAVGRGGRGPGAPGAAVPHDDPNSAESRLVGAPIQTAPDKVRSASPLTYVHDGAPPFLIMHGLADNSVPHQQSILLYESLVAAGNDVTLRLVDGLPHTFFNRTNLDELAGPFRMDVRTHPKNGHERFAEDHARVFDVARSFFSQNLQ